MSSFDPALEKLIESFQFLPGVGRKTAIRMSLFALQYKNDEAKAFADTLLDAVNTIQTCETCRNLSEHRQCGICSNPRRDAKVRCIVESVADLAAIEEANVFDGKYFVLHGTLSPIDGIGPRQLGIDRLIKLIHRSGVEELVIAINPSVEGEATSQYITDHVPDQVKVSKIAHGVPIGGEIGYANTSTIAHAFTGRTILVR